MIILCTLQDPIARLSFAAAPTSIAINQTTLSSDRIDIVVGFSTGDLLWMEVFSGRYTRYNKDASTPPSNNKVVGYVSSAAVKRLQWLAGDQVFVAGFADGCLAFYDKDREDPSGFTPSQGLAPSAAPTGQQPSLLARMDSRLGLGVEGSAQTADPFTPGSYQEERDGMSKAGSRRLASYREAVEETTSDIVVTIPAANSEKKTAGKLNPLAHWKVSRKSITGKWKCRETCGTRSDGNGMSCNVLQTSLSRPIALTARWSAKTAVFGLLTATLSDCSIHSRRTLAL